jgi:tetratricopeptide (TPR) repeat protein
LLMGQDESAQKDYDEYLKLRPGSERYLEDLAKTYVPVLKQNPSPKTAQEFLTRGNALYNATYYTLAAADYSRAAELDEFNPDAFYNLGTAFKQLNYADAALYACRRCLEADDRYFEAYERIGDISRMKFDKYDDAVEAYSNAIKIKPDLMTAWAGRGGAHMLLEKYPEAIKDFDKALELDATNVYSWTFRGQSYFKMGQVDKALADLDKALELNPGYDSALRNRGDIRRAKGDYEGAIADYTAWNQVTPGAYPLMCRGLALLEEGKAAEAQKDFDESLRLYPGIKEEMDKEIAKAKAVASHASAGK